MVRQQFVEDAVSVGVDGVIVPDLPPEESIELSAYAEKKGLDVIHLLAPTSPDERIRIIAKQSTRFYLLRFSYRNNWCTRATWLMGLRNKVASIKLKFRPPSTYRIWYFES